MNKLKRIMAIAAVLMGVLNVGFAKDSHALIGLAFKSKPVKVIGGIGTGAGAVVGVYGAGLAYSSAATLGSVIVGAIFIAYGIVIAGVGLVVLDDPKNATDVEFKAIDARRPEQYVGFTAAQVETYNSELDRLNAIRQTIVAESNDEADTKDAEVLWNAYATLLSSDTVAIAQSKAAEFLKAIQ